MDDREKILIVDDNQEMRYIVRHILEDHYLIFEAGDGESALKMAQDLRPDLLILDVVLPDISGYSVCTQMKSNSELRSIPIIMLSGNTGLDARVTGYNLGVIHYLEKPFEAAELKAIVRNTLAMNLDKPILKIGEISVHLHNHTVSILEREVHFTNNEFKILSILMTHFSEIVSRDKLLKCLGNEGDEGAGRVIDTHISTIRRKIKKSNVKIKSIYSQGYKIIEMPKFSSS